MDRRSSQLDLREFLGIDENVPAGYRRIGYTVFLEGDGTREQFEDPGARRGPSGSLAIQHQPFMDPGSSPG